MRFRVVIAFLFLTAVTSPTFAGTFTENFTTRAYEDTLATTADWDTTAGQLKLFPFAPSLVGSISISDLLGGFAVSGDHIFIAGGSSGLLVVDLSNPANPTVVGSYDTPGYAINVAVDGSYAFVADETDGLVILNISNPASPTLLGSVDTPGTARSVAVDGNYAFVADQSGGLQVVNITNPASPTLIGSVATPDDAYDVVVDGKHAFIADNTAGLQVIDITNPASPSLVGSYTTAGQALGVAVDGDQAFVVDGTGLLVIDITNLASPSLLGSVATPDPAYDVAVDGNRAFVADYTNGLQMVDITDPANPTLAGGYVTPGFAYGVGVDGDLAFIISYNGGLSLIRISDPVSPILVGSYEPFYAYGVAVAGNHAFIADGAIGLEVVDISDTASPTLAGTYSTPGDAAGVTVAGDLAFVADGGYLDVVDISDPANPTLFGNITMPGLLAWDVAVAGDYAYVAAGDSGLVTVDISNPSSPSRVGNLKSLDAYAQDIALAGDLALVTNGYPDGLEVIDISNPSSPTLMSSYYPQGGARPVGIAVEGRLAFVAGSDFQAGETDLDVVDISNPASPTLVGTYTAPGTGIGPYGVSLDGDRVFVIDGSFLHAIDISDPANPTDAGTISLGGSGRDVAVDGDFAFVAATDAFQVFRVSQQELDLTRNIGQSLAVDGGSNTILGAQLSSTQSGDVAWELSADGGADFQSFLPGGGAMQFAWPGTDLVWRSTLGWSSSAASVSSVTLDWLNEFAPLASITDVPNDQGGWVRMRVIRSGYDFAAEDSLPVTGYEIYRRVDSTTAAAVQKLPTTENLMEAKTTTTPLQSFGPAAVRQMNGRTFVLGSQVTPTANATFPAGTWEAVNWVAATQSDDYKVLAPTAVDSSSAGPGWSIFLVTTHTTTPSVWYVSAPDSGYSVDNIAPGVPQNLVAAYNTGGGNQLSWDANTDPDLQYYRVYRDVNPDFVASSGNFVTGTATTSWTDPAYDGGSVYYEVTAVDHDGNESNPASPDIVTSVPGRPVPSSFALHQNFPNPFNPSTTIHYDVPRGGGNVKLQIFDLSGRLINTLVDSYQKEGQQTVTWHGRDAAGRPVATGTYFSRLTAPGITQTKKMVMVK